MSFDPNRLKQYPSGPGIYLMKDAFGTILYVGKANSLNSRLKQYFQKNSDLRAMIPYLLEKIDSIETIVTNSEKEALILENNLIKKHKPKYNTLFKDDKSYVCIAINIKHSFPTLRLVRYHMRSKRDALYFGPYPNAWVAKQTIQALFSIFQLRQCSDRELQSRSRPCILYGIKKCTAPCTLQISKEEYGKKIEEIIQFLKGNNTKVFKMLESEMQKASKKCAFEKAKMLLDQINTIKKLLERQKVETKFKYNIDCIGFFRLKEDSMITLLSFKKGMLVHSKQYFLSQHIENMKELLETFLIQHYLTIPHLPEVLLVPHLNTPLKVLETILLEKRKKQIKIQTPVKGFKLNLLKMANQNAKANFEQQKNIDLVQEKLLFDIQDSLKLKNFPKRIECLDISSFGRVNVGSLICFIQGKKAPHFYRKYRIEKPQDDYGAILEVLQRRIKKAKLEDLPDLLIIDGGKGHLNVAAKVLNESNITTVDLIALSKEKSLHTKGLTRECVHSQDLKNPLFLDERSAELFLLQRIRDEAHRFAQSYQKKRTQKQLIYSQLDSIPSIGPKKKKMLLDHFKSVANLKLAKIEDLEKVKGLSKTNIAYLLDFIN
ncbi:MAG: UvrABC system protein C [Chlamydiae bacterium]|nr:UvrABC system protein C [Chlamydiota bacterium]